MKQLKSKPNRNQLLRYSPDARRLLEASWFSICPRDEKGRCEDKGAGGASPSPKASAPKPAPQPTTLQDQAISRLRKEQAQRTLRTRARNQIAASRIAEQKRRDMYKREQRAKNIQSALGIAATFVNGGKWVNPESASSQLSFAMPGVGPLSLPRSPTMEMSPARDMVRAKVAGQLTGEIVSSALPVLVPLATKKLAAAAFSNPKIAAGIGAASLGAYGAKKLYGMGRGGIKDLYGKAKSKVQARVQQELKQNPEMRWMGPQILGGMAGAMAGGVATSVPVAHALGLTDSSRKGSVGKDIARTLGWSAATLAGGAAGGNLGILAAVKAMERRSRRRKSRESAITAYSPAARRLLEKSWFEICPRDEKGHCEDKGSAGASAKGAASTAKAAPVWYATNPYVDRELDRRARQGTLPGGFEGWKPKPKPKARPKGFRYWLAQPGNKTKLASTVAHLGLAAAGTMAGHAALPRIAGPLYRLGGLSPGVNALLPLGLGTGIAATLPALTTHIGDRAGELLLKKSLLRTKPRGKKQAEDDSMLVKSRLLRGAITAGVAGAAGLLAGRTGSTILGDAVIGGQAIPPAFHVPPSWYLTRNVARLRRVYDQADVGRKILTGASAALAGAGAHRAMTSSKLNKNVQWAKTPAGRAALADKAKMAVVAAATAAGAYGANRLANRAGVEYLGNFGPVTQNTFNAMRAGINGASVLGGLAADELASKAIGAPSLRGSAQNKAAQYKKVWDNMPAKGRGRLVGGALGTVVGALPAAAVIHNAPRYGVPSSLTNSAMASALLAGPIAGSYLGGKLASNKKKPKPRARTVARSREAAVSRYSPDARRLMEGFMSSFFQRCNRDAQGRCMPEGAAAQPSASSQKGSMDEQRKEITRRHMQNVMKDYRRARFLRSTLPQVVGMTGTMAAAFGAPMLRTGVLTLGTLAGLRKYADYKRNQVRKEKVSNTLSPYEQRLERDRLQMKRALYAQNPKAAFGALRKRWDKDRQTRQAELMQLGMQASGQIERPRQKQVAA